MSEVASGCSFRHLVDVASEENAKLDLEIRANGKLYAALFTPLTKNATKEEKSRRAHARYYYKQKKLKEELQKKAPMHTLIPTPTGYYRYITYKEQTQEIRRLQKMVTELIMELHLRDARSTLEEETNTNKINEENVCTPDLIQE